MLHKELAGETKEIVECLENVRSLHEGEFENALAIATVRRSLFLQICKFKIMVDNFKERIKELSEAKLNKSGNSGKQRNSTKKNWTVVTHLNDVKLDGREAELHALSASKTDADVHNRSGAIFETDVPIVVPEAKSGKQDWTLNDSRFGYMRKGNLTLPLCEGDICVPVYQDDDMSIIAYTLMSNDYHE
jgi:hypothetical protein